ncbi:GNAT family N-acetyltransferase [Streptomyces sp. AV19]|uniref:GNAT family N-acetyltransferase n=1 Tax=Streptomyces sp. AV19 TaxID=2793068 RepID=UPI0018FEDA10|nr:GNAT family N-acetyltransferase [Streptomyces sp. AV19]MBH1934375.1 GNAT family N-acetyltransferase [Streptomyces sp. AV19]MDG4536223.1 GNAT family N-acetyltransferase [Streptomyces sp. AV19]
MDHAEIVPMRLSHLDAVLNLGYRAYDVNAMPYTSWSLSSVAEHWDAQPEACWVAMDDEGLLGFVLGSLSYDEREDWGYLEWIALDERARGKGIASALVQRCCDALFAAGASRIITDVEADNKASADMMRRNGFTEGVTVTLFVRSDPTRPTPPAPHPPRDPARTRLRRAARTTGTS